MVEKYIKCILLLNRIPGKRIGHDLSRGMDALQKSRKVDLNLTDRTRSFIEYLDTFGKYRYLEISNVATGKSLTWLDRTAWELRRFCTLDQGPRKLSLQHGVLPPKYQIAGGYLENLISDRTKPAREALLWSNAFFGLRRRRLVRVNPWFTATNSPLYLNPQILDEVLRYVHVPDKVVAGYRKHQTSS
jgi:hypothetical protein